MSVYCTGRGINKRNGNKTKTNRIIKSKINIYMYSVFKINFSSERYFDMSVYNFSVFSSSLT